MTNLGQRSYKGGRKLSKKAKTQENIPHLAKKSIPERRDGIHAKWREKTALWEITRD